MKAILSTEKYFTDAELLALTPYICLILGGMYCALHLIGWLLIKEPVMTSSGSSIENTPRKDDSATQTEEIPSYGSCGIDTNSQGNQIEDIVPLDAIRTKEFYLVYFCRFLITPITQVRLRNLYSQYNKFLISVDHNFTEQLI